MVKTVMKGLENNVPPNPEVVSDLLFDPKRLEAMQKARGIVGDSLWKYVQAAHAQKIIQNSMTVEPGVLNGKRFADQIEHLVQTGCCLPLMINRLPIGCSRQRRMCANWKVQFLFRSARTTRFRP